MSKARKQSGADSQDSHQADEENQESATDAELDTGEAFDSLDDESAEITVVERAGVHIGPIPPPSWFDQYERTLPGAADRILSLAEKAQEASQKRWEMVEDRKKKEMEMDEKRDRLAHKEKKLGTLAGIVAFSLLVISSLIVALITWDPILSGIFLTTAALSVVGVFARRR